MQGMLQCLDWDHRLVYILSETMDVTGPEGSAILGIKSSTFRKRLSRSRVRIRDFLMRNCELFDNDNPCKCIPQAVSAIKKGYMDPDRLQYAKHPSRGKKCMEAATQIRILEGLSREAALMRAHPDYAAPDAFIAGIRQMLDSGKFHKLRNLH